MLNPAEETRGALVIELKRLRSKQAATADKDIQQALNLKIDELETRIQKLDEASAKPDSSAGPETQDPAHTRAQIELELKRLRAKHDAVGDADLQSALALSIEGLKARLKQLEVYIASEPEVLPEPPTPEQKEAADKLVQQARVEKMRGNARGVADLLAEASQVAPGSAEVLELLADEFAEQRKFEEAIATYDKARKLDPKNVNVDRKHANLVFHAKAVGASAAMSIAEHEALATDGNKASLFSVVLPGAGQFVLGKYGNGSFYFGLWASMIIWLLLKKADVLGLLSAIGIHAKGANAQFNVVIAVPIAVAAITHVASVLNCRSAGRHGMRPKVKIDRPAPPVNLPFE
ncbi:MAG: hypothetical protein ACYC96_01295 [Fimbriimonadaceae bacterium]